MKIFAVVLFIVVLMNQTFGQKDLFTGDSNSGDSKTKSLHLKVAKNWLSSQLDLRFASIADYKDQDAFDFFDPVYTKGDFNNDKINDFAVMLISKNKTNSLSTAIFNGPFDLKKKQTPTLYIPNIKSDYSLGFLNGELTIQGSAEDEVLYISIVGKSYKVKKVIPKKSDDDFDK